MYKGVDSRLAVQESKAAQFAHTLSIFIQTYL